MPKMTLTNTLCSVIFYCILLIFRMVLNSISKKKFSSHLVHFRLFWTSVCLKICHSRIFAVTLIMNFVSVFCSIHLQNYFFPKLMQSIFYFLYVLSIFRYCLLLFPLFSSNCFSCFNWFESVKYSIEFHLEYDTRIGAFSIFLLFPARLLFSFIFRKFLIFSDFRKKNF